MQYNYGNNNQLLQMQIYKVAISEKEVAQAQPLEMLKRTRFAFQSTYFLK